MENGEIVEVKINKKEINFIVWLVPLIALIVGGWMIYKYYSQLGPKIYITFKNSGGVEPKQSFIKFRDVKVGVVERVEILKGSDGVMVVARMNRDVKPFLNKTTKFWLVKPEIGVGKIRGLDALFSGTYIQMYAKLEDSSKRFFKGLEEPPLNLFERDGKTFKLIANKSYGLRQGSFVYYKQIVAGSVEKLLVKDGKVLIYIFVKEPYVKYINSSTRFWNIENVSVKIAKSGVDFELSPISQIILGGIEFESLMLDSNKSSTLFRLYPNKKEAFKKRLGVGMEEYMTFKAFFKGSLEGIETKSGVFFKGFKIGEVQQIQSVINSDYKSVKNRVFLKIDLSAFKQKDEDDGFKRLKELIKRGLKARVEHSFLGLSYINLVFEKEATLKRDGKYYLFPTTSPKKSDILKTAQQILKKIEKLPLDKSMKKINKLLDEAVVPVREFGATLKKINRYLDMNDTKAIPKESVVMLRELTSTLKSFKKLANSYSNPLLKAKIDALLKDLDDSLKEAKNFLIKIEKKPNRLIFGD